jgi:hypothetical protein
MRKGIDDSFYVFAAIFGVTVIVLRVVIGIINIFI